MTRKRRIDNDDELIKEFSKKNSMIAKLCQDLKLSDNINERKELADEIRKLEDEVKILQKKIMKTRFRSIRSISYIPYK